MPKLKTNKDRVISAPDPKRESGFCIASYDDYLAQRVEVPDVSAEKVKEITNNFRMSISEPVHKLNPSIEMGEYFVIPVKELREMLDKSGDKPEFIHVCNGLRTVKNSAGDTMLFPVTIIVPYERVKNSQGKEEISICKNPNSVFIEAYPCPPDPRCPKGFTDVKEGIFPDNLKLNSFNSLF
jgi:hypothetical protein